MNVKRRLVRKTQYAKTQMVRLPALAKKDMKEMALHVQVQKISIIVKSTFKKGHYDEKFVCLYF